MGTQGADGESACEEAEVCAEMLASFRGTTRGRDQARRAAALEARLRELSRSLRMAVVCELPAEALLGLIAPIEETIDEAHALLFAPDSSRRLGAATATTTPPPRHRRVAESSRPTRPAPENYSPDELTSEAAWAASKA